MSLALILSYLSFGLNGGLSVAAWAGGAPVSWLTPVLAGVSLIMICILEVDRWSK